MGVGAICRGGPGEFSCVSWMASNFQIVCFVREQCDFLIRGTAFSGREGATGTDHQCSAALQRDEKKGVEVLGCWGSCLVWYFGRVLGV